MMVGHAHFSPGRPSGIEDPLGIVMGTLYCRSHLLCQRSFVKEHVTISLKVCVYRVYFQVLNYHHFNAF